MHPLTVPWNYLCIGTVIVKKTFRSIGGFLLLQVWHMAVKAARVLAPSPAPPLTALRPSPRVCHGHRAWTSTLPPVKRGTHSSVTCEMCFC